MGILAGNTDFFIGVSANGNVNSVEFFAQLIKGNFALAITNAAVEMNLHAGGQDGVQVLLQAFAGEAISGDAIAQHAAELALFFKNNCMVTHELQIVGSG